MVVQQYVVHPSYGVFKNDKGHPVDAVTIYAPTAVIAEQNGIATGIPTANWDQGFIIDTENFDVFPLYVDPKTGIKSWKKVEV